jgi:hypothetical protein
MKTSNRRMLWTAIFALVVAFVAGCGSIVASVLDVYTGPEPDRKDITEETVIIRKVETQPGTGIQFFLVDRERYLTSAPHSINRIVEVTSRDLQPAVAEMQLKAGDRVRLSTDFLSFRMVGELSQYLDDWPYDKYSEYPIGFHLIRSVERTAP